MPPQLVVRDLRKSYLAGFGRCWARVQVLRGVSFTVAHQQRLGIVGGRATGKTTLLHCLAGLRRIDGGEIRWVRRPTAHDTRRIYTRPSQLCATDADPLLIDLSERDDSIVEWTESLGLLASSTASWILAARRLGPITHLCDTVLLLEEGLVRPRAGRPDTRRVAEPGRRSR
jgi:ABC-type antimicrobial peptide transport system ATPase subunit